jgi:Fe-S-cluster containining protein
LVKRGELALPAPHGMIEAMADLRQKLTALKVELNELRARCDAAFHKVSLEHAAAVACKTGCDDCCHALFDLAPMEVLALAIAFKQLPRNERREALRRAEKAAQIYDETALKVLAAKEDQRLKLLSQARVPCPLLSKGRCILYAERPATCRLYGIPVAIQGNARTCNKARFKEGGTYPTVDWDQVNQQLDHLSAAAVSLVPTLTSRRLDVARTIQMDL